MKKSMLYLLLVLVISAFLLAACGGGGGQATQAPVDAPAVDRPEPPAPYAGMTNPHAGDAAAATAGQQIYQTNCASCHGDTGVGDGPAAAALDPAPQNLAVNQQGLGDDYLYWRIAEGGAFAPFNSSMPPWKGVLSEDEIWQVVTHIRTFGR